MNGLVAFGCGLVFALGLGLGGMTQPSRVLAFLDVAGRWDPALAFVMASAVATYAVAVRVAARRARPLRAESFDVPTRRDVDAQLVSGAALFGIGWGLAGLCPGPALVSLASGSPAAMVFLAAMLAGMVRRPATPVLPRPRRPAPRAAESQPGANWPIPPGEAEQLFADAPMELLAYERLRVGVSGACKAEVSFTPATRPMGVKWKLAPSGSLDGWNNNPRKEIACYVLQQWFLDPQDYVVPTVMLRGVPVTAFRRFDPKMAPSIDGTRDVLGTVSLWLDDVQVPRVLYDPTEFARDGWYAYHLSNFNVLTYLVGHRDARPGNVLVSAADHHPRRVYAVDNGISFGSFVYNFLTTNWDVIRVPAIRSETVERLRAVDRSKLDALGTLVELAADGSGGLRPVPGRAPIDRDRGVRVTEDRVQMGLTRAEIDAVEGRRTDLLRRVDDGTQVVF